MLLAWKSVHRKGYDQAEAVHGAEELYGEVIHGVFLLKKMSQRNYMRA